jgi:hypothetical protein
MKLNNNQPVEINILTRVTVNDILEDIKKQAECMGDYKKDRDKMFMRIEYYLALLQSSTSNIIYKQKDKKLKEFA